MITRNFVRRSSAVLVILSSLCIFSGASHAAGLTSIFGGESLVPLLQAQSLRVTSRDGQYILNLAWPLAFGMLQYQSADLLGTSETDTGYAISTRINYLNLLNRPHFLKLTFYYDGHGSAESLKISGYSDIIGPQNVDPARLLELVSFSGTSRFSSPFVAKAYTGVCGS